MDRFLFLHWIVLTLHLSFAEFEFIDVHSSSLKSPSETEGLSTSSSSTLLQCFVCPRCGKQYKHRSSLDKHMRLVCEVEKQFKCPTCDYRCSRKTDLQTHVFHRHERPKDAVGSHRCPKCDKAYHHRHSMLSHLRHECGIDPQFKCPFCPHRCKLKTNLDKHLLRRHSNIQLLPVSFSNYDISPTPNLQLNLSNEYSDNTNGD